MRQRCDNLAKLVSGDMAEGINEFARCKSLTCADCLAASSTELPFPCWAREQTRQRHCISFPWMFVGHSWTTTRRCQLFAQLLASRRCLRWCRKLSIYIESQCGHAYCIVRTDNGSEDVYTELTDFFNAKGTVHQRTVPYTPEQNGAAERLKQTLLERVLRLVPLLIPPAEGPVVEAPGPGRYPRREWRPAGTFSGRARRAAR